MSTSFRNVFRRGDVSRIEIPIVQRDYAQGRKDGGVPRIRKAFLKHHRNLLDPRFWQDAQQKIRNGYVEDFYPYPQELRFSHLYADDSAPAG